MHVNFVRLFGAIVEALTSADKDQEVHQVGDLCIDVDRVQISWKSTQLDLTLTEFWIVHALAKRPGHVKTRDQLMDDAKIFVDDTTITSHIKRIRKKFKEIDEAFDAIETVYGMGYRWLTTVT